MDTYDIVIVGAGPSGSSVAYNLDSKHKVLVVDRFNFPRSKACGGTLFFCRDWEKEFPQYVAIKNKLHSRSEKKIYFYYKLKEMFSLKKKHLYDWVDRAEFDTLLLQEALKKSNVSFKKFGVERIENKGKWIYLIGKKGKIRTKYVVGADGCSSVISSFLGNKKRTINDFFMTISYEVEAKLKKDCAHTFFLTEGEISNSWIIPTSIKNHHYIGLGTIRKTKKPQKALLDNFLRELVEKKLLPKNYKILRSFGAPDPISIVKRYCSEKIFLCGDAAGLVSEISGEGIYYAIKSGILLAEVLNKEKNKHKKYTKKINKLKKKIPLLIFPPKIIMRSIVSFFLFCMSSKFVPKIIRKKIQNWFFNKYARGHKKIKESYYPYENDIQEPT